MEMPTESVAISERDVTEVFDFVKTLTTEINPESGPHLFEIEDESVVKWEKIISRSLKVKFAQCAVRDVLRGKLGIKCTVRGVDIPVDWNRISTSVDIQPGVAIGENQIYPDQSFYIQAVDPHHSLTTITAQARNRLTLDAIVGAVRINYKNRTGTFSLTPQPPLENDYIPGKEKEYFKENLGTIANHNTPIEYSVRGFSRVSDMNKMPEGSKASGESFHYDQDTYEVKNERLISDTESVKQMILSVIE
jgi:hypothetical protein